MINPIPAGLHTVTPYLIVEGAPQFLDFLKQAFAAQEIRCTKLPNGNVLHAEIKIGDSVLMASEAKSDFPAMPCMIHLYVTDADAVYQQSLQAGAISVMEPTDEFYGDRAAGVKDAFGNYWWIATHQEDLSPEELEKRVATFAAA